MSDPQPSLARLFFDRARQVYLGERTSIGLPLADLVEMCSEVATQLELIRLVRGQNDPHFRDLLVLFLEQAADKLEETGSEIDDNVDLLDRAGLAPTAAVTAGAVALIVASGGAAAPILVLVAGTIGIGALGVGRSSLKGKARKQKGDAKRVRGLAAKLRTEK